MSMWALLQETERGEEDEEEVWVQPQEKGAALGVSRQEGKG